MGAALCEISVKLKVVTPILGGAAVTRTIDEVDIIRVPTVRGHLRFWWRALHAHDCANQKEMFEAETELWGRAATEERREDWVAPRGRSAVDVRVTVLERGHEHDSGDPLRALGAYALWPARLQGGGDYGHLPRRKPGTTIFTLKLIGPSDRKTELCNVVRAWILFGGYGSRTRRGLGSLTVVDDVSSWLPAAATRDELTALFARDVFTGRGMAAQETPWLADAALHVGAAGRNPIAAWTTALDWLKEFRQGPRGGAKGSAREPDAGGDKNRPSISNWPEPDKARHNSALPAGSRWAHTPRHNADGVWPRAGFGLPMIAQYQSLSRVKRPGWRRGDKVPEFLRWNELPTTHPNYGLEPRDACNPTKLGYELRWRSALGEHGRLASPLLVKALPLANGQFVPCALWLARGLPQNAEVGLAEPVHGHAGEKRVKAASAAPFDKLEDSPGAALFAPLRNKHTLRDAFLDWLKAQSNITVVAP